MRLLISLILLLNTTNLFAPKFFRQYELPWPIENPRVTQEFNLINHDGLDMISFISREVKSIENCRVVEISKTVNLTPRIICRNELFEYHYLHVFPLVKVNEEIKSGQLIAYYNNEGKSSGAHLHLIMINNLTKELLNPIVYLK